MPRPHKTGFLHTAALLAFMFLIVAARPAAADAVPNQFTFTDKTGAPLTTVVASDPVRIIGTNSALAITGTAGAEVCVSTANHCGCDTLPWSTLPVGGTPLLRTDTNVQYVCARNTSSGVNDTPVDTTITIGGVSDIFTIRTLVSGADATPDAFTFADQTGVPISTLTTSAPVLITGMAAMATWAATGGTACVGTNTTNCGCTTAEFAASGVVAAGQYLCARHTSVGTASSPTNTTVTIAGSVNDTFTSTTAGASADTAPNSFSFTDQAGVALSTVITSAPVQITGIDASAAWSLSGGSACVGTNATNCGCADGVFAATGTIANNQYICVRNTSSGVNNTAVNTTVTVGGVQDIFSITTLVAGQATGGDTVPATFTFTDVTNVATSTTMTSAPVQITGIDAMSTWVVTDGGAGTNYSACAGTNTTNCGCAVNDFAQVGTITNNQYICARHTSSASNLTVVGTVVTVGGIPDTFESTTQSGSADTTPDSFSFVDQTGVALNTAITSAPVLITGIDATAGWSATLGTACVGTNTTNCACSDGAFAASGTITNNQYICARHTSSGSNSTAVNTTVTVGGVSDIFTSVTIATGADTTPNAFSFTDQTGVALSTVITSGPVQITGIDAATAWSASGGTVCVGSNTTNCGCADGAFSASGSVTNNGYICARHTSSASNSTAVNTIVTVGGVSDTFTSTTTASGGPPDTTPDAFAFTDQTGVPLSTVITSNAITVSGINTATAISVSGGEYNINSGTFTSSAGTVTNGQTVAVRHTSSASNSTATNTTLTIGGVSDTFTSTTLASGADTTPDAFTFTDQTGVALSTLVTSNTITVSGITAQAAISVTGGEYNINGGAFTTAAGFVSNTNTVSVRHTSSATNSTAVNTTLTIGGVIDTFTSTTVAAGGGGGPFALTASGPTNGIIISGDNLIFCDRTSGPDCTETYTSGASVALTAVPEVGYSFSLWGSGLGACSTNNTNPCTVSMTAATAAAATMTAVADTGSGARVTTTVNGLPGSTNLSLPAGFVNVQYTIRSCPELYVIVNAPALGINWAYINSAGTALALPTLNVMTPHRTSLADGTYTLYAATAPAGLYDLYLMCDNAVNGTFDFTSSGLNGVFTHLRATMN